jgi:SAM-dependent MidA family methyltransferase
VKNIEELKSDYNSKIDQLSNELISKFPAQELRRKKGKWLKKYKAVLDKEQALKNEYLQKIKTG